jgi:hypothetical protein
METVDYSIVSATGQLLKNGRLTRGQNMVDMTTLDPGVYFLTAGHQIRYQSVIAVLGSN